MSDRSEAFLPLMLLAPALLGRARETAACVAAYALARLCTLCGAEGFARAAGALSSRRGVRRAWTGAALFALAAGFAAWRWGVEALARACGVDVDARAWNALWIVGMSLALARLMEAHLRAAGQAGSAALCAFVRAALLAGGLLCGGDWTAASAALGLLTALAVGAGVGGNPLGAPGGAALLKMPLATVRALAYPLGAIALAAKLPGAQGVWTLCGYLLGLAAYGCAAAPFRRARTESGEAHIALAVPAAIACALVPPFCESLRAGAALVALAAVCGLAVYAAPCARAALLAACVAGAGAAGFFEPALAWPLSACALLLLIPDAREEILRAKARRLQNRRGQGQQAR